MLVLLCISFCILSFQRLPCSAAAAVLSPIDRLAGCGREVVEHQQQHGRPPVDSMVVSEASVILLKLGIGSGNSLGEILDVEWSLSLGTISHCLLR